MARNMIFATVKRNGFRRNSFRNTSVGNLDIISLSTVDQGWFSLDVRALDSEIQ